MIRKPSVAGMFYAGTKEQLNNQLKQLIPKQTKTKIDAIGIVSPHAGYPYSGYVAGELFARINIPDEILIFCFNHSSMGSQFALWERGEWSTPLGEVKLSKELTRLTKDCYKQVQYDPHGHYNEHSAEVQLPFLQYFKPDVKITVIALTVGLSPEEVSMLKEFGTSVGEALKNYKKDVLILASSDFTHYEPQRIASENDKRAIEHILKLDEDQLVSTIKKYRISMCGYAPIIALISACKKLDAKKGELIKYMTSGDVTGDYSAVVGYAGIAITK
jgi:hypothetical protein